MAIAFPEAFDVASVEAAKTTLASYHPEDYERHFCVVLKPGESRAKDKRQFILEHQNDWLVTAAWGSWHPTVPDGFVGVVASLGSDVQRIGAERWFLVPEHEYKTQGGQCYVCHAGHEPWEPHA